MKAAVIITPRSPVRTWDTGCGSQLADNTDCDGCMFTVDQDGSGEYVLTEDYKTLQDERDRLQAALVNFRAAFANDGKTTSLRDWNERLKAADAAAALALEDEPRTVDLPGAIDWQDVKTGARGKMCGYCGHELTEDLDNEPPASDEAQPRKEAP